MICGGQKVKRNGQEHRQKLTDLIRNASHRHATWRVWDDLIYMGSASIAQAFTYSQKREDEYLKRIGQYDKGTQNLFPQMFNEIVLAFEQEGCTDVLGDIYTDLNLSNHWRGQFFTPDCICKAIAKMQFANTAGLIQEQGFITVSDPACGGGAMLIAFAEACSENDVNYQRDVMFVGQDIDVVVARMCYISMSLLGMPGYVITGDTLLMETRDVMYTPLYFVSGFPWRRKRKDNNPKIEQLDLDIAQPRVPAGSNVRQNNEVKQIQLIF